MSTSDWRIVSIPTKAIAVTIVYFRNGLLHDKTLSKMHYSFSEPQEDNPKITFNKDVYEIGDVLVANCTTALSRPPPHITWLINDQKVSSCI